MLDNEPRIEPVRDDATEETASAEDSKEIRDFLKRQRAFEDYFAMGVHRSVNKLYEQYKATVRDNPMNRRNVPTLNRNTIYEWSKIDNWDLRVRQREIAQSAAARQAAEEVRQRAYDNIALLTDLAIENLKNIIQMGDRDETRLKAILTVLDRIGAVPLVRERTEKPQADATRQQDTPPADADDSTIAAFLTNRRKQERFG